MNVEDLNSNAPRPFNTNEYITVGELCPIRLDVTMQPTDYGLVCRVSDDEKEKIAAIVMASRGLVRYTESDVHIESIIDAIGTEFTIHPTLQTSVFYDQIGDPLLMLSDEQYNKIADVYINEIETGYESVTMNTELPENIVHLVMRAQTLASRVLDYLWDDD